MSAMDLLHPTLTRVGIFEYDPTVERYEVEPGSTAVIALAAGDRILLVDRQGAQGCGLVALDERWRDALAAVDLKAAGRGLAPGSVTGLQAARRRFLKVWGAAAVDPAELRVAHLLGTASPPGAAWSAKADRDLVVLVSVPHARMEMSGAPATAQSRSLCCRVCRTRTTRGGSRRRGAGLAGPPRPAQPRSAAEGRSPPGTSTISPQCYRRQSVCPDSRP